MHYEGNHIAFVIGYELNIWLGYAYILIWGNRIFVDLRKELEYLLIWGNRIFIDLRKENIYWFEERKYILIWGNIIFIDLRKEIIYWFEERDYIDLRKVNIYWDWGNRIYLRLRWLIWSE